MWQRHLTNLLSRSWNNLLEALSSSTPAVIISFALPALTFVVVIVYRHAEARAKKRPMTKADFKVTIIPTLISAGITLIFWFCLFGWSIVATVYKDHQYLVAAVKKYKDQVTTEPTSGPQLRGEFNFVAGGTVTKGLLGNLRGKKVVTIIVGATIYNSGMPSIASGWELIVKLMNGEEVKGSMAALPPKLTGKGHTFLGEDALYDRAGLTPIPTGGAVPGLLFFYFTGMEQAQFNEPGTKYVLTFADVNKRQHKCSHVMTGNKEDFRFHVPGIKSPL